MCEETETMSGQQAGKPRCENCVFWQGKLSSYLGSCEHPRNYPSRVAFDASCRLFSERKPMLSMQSMVRGQPMSYYKQ
jgi:hypothetical protein